MLKYGLPLLLAVLPAAAGGPTAPYGFSGMEIYKIAQGIGELTPCDADGDGKTDLLVVNNTKARIEVFLRRDKPVPPKSRKGEPRPNDLAYDHFYERKEILTEKQVTSIAAADLNGDGKVDVAYYGKPQELVVAYGDGSGAFPETTRFPITDGRTASRCLAAGDLNGDGRADLVLLAEKDTQILYQGPKGTLREPVKLPHSTKAMRAVMVIDLNGDGRADLVHISGDARSVRVNYQQEDGSLGAEIGFETPPWRAIDVLDLDPSPGAEVVLIQRTSGVLRVLRPARKPAEHGLGSIEMHAFEATRGSRKRSLGIGDVNGDGRQDVVVTEPGIAQVAVYLQDAKGRLPGRKLYPSLADSEAVRVADLTGDGKAEIVVLSSGERAVGVASFADGRLPFPKLLDLPGTPKAIETGDVNGDGKADLVVVVETDEQGGKTKKKLFLFYEQGAEGLPTAPTRTIENTDRRTPDDLMLFDVDQDGRNDLLLFDHYGPLRIWLCREDGTYRDLAAEGRDYRGGLLNKITRGAVNTGDVDGDGKPELLAASKNFARALRLEGALQVVDQASGASPRSQIKGAAALDLDGDGKLEIALYDREKGGVTLLGRDASGVFTLLANLETGELDYRALRAADLNGDGKDDLVLFGENRFGVLYAGGFQHELVELHTVESSVRDAALAGFTVGDLNGDGRPDVAAFDARNKEIQIFSYDPQQGFEEEIRWKIYEEKLHERRGRRSTALSGLLIRELTGDGLADMALLVHDRLIVYRQ